MLVEDIVEEEVEKVKRCHVPYERLDISCKSRAINKEEVHYLFDEKQKGVPSGSGTSKWLSKSESRDKKLWIAITVKEEYPPLILTHYALKSANDAPNRDPKQWDLYYLEDDDENRPIYLHQKQD